ncbi:MAG: 5'-deoxynucleotidase [Lawsonibacter sp.]
MSSNFFPMIARMRYINRWGLMRNTDLENIQEHSHMVAVLAHALAVIENEKFGGQVDAGAVAVAALYHDASEILTGDMPTPIKYDNPDIQAAYKEVESVAEQKLLSMLPPDLRGAYDEVITIPDPHIRGLVKAADKLSAYLKCVEELKAGNMEFKQARSQTYAALCQNPIPALRYFMDHFLAGFDLTLDELQRGGKDTERNMTP